MHILSLFDEKRTKSISPVEFRLFLIIYIFSNRQAVSTKPYKHKIGHKNNNNITKYFMQSKNI